MYVHPPVRPSRNITGNRRLVREAPNLARWQSSKFATNLRPNGRRTTVQDLQIQGSLFAITLQNGITWKMLTFNIVRTTTDKTYVLVIEFFRFVNVYRLQVSVSMPAWTSFRLTGPHNLSGASDVQLSVHRSSTNTCDKWTIDVNPHLSTLPKEWLRRQNFYTSMSLWHRLRSRAVTSWQ